MKGSSSSWLAIALLIAALGIGSLVVFGGRGPARGEGGGQAGGESARSGTELDSRGRAGAGRAPSIVEGGALDGGPGVEEGGSAQRSVLGADGTPRESVEPTRFAGEILAAGTLAPLASVHVDVTLGERHFEVETDEEGRFAIDVPGAVANVALEHARHVDRWLPDLNLTAPARVLLEPSATLVGWIRPMSDEVEVIVWHQAASGQRFWFEYRPEVEETGRFELTDLTPGEYLAASYSPDGSNARQAGITLDPGETTTVTLEASFGATVRGLVTRFGTGTSVPGVELRFEPKADLPRVLRDAGQRSTVSGDDGRYVLYSVAPGVYRVNAEAPGYGTKRIEFEVPASGDLIEQDIELSGPGAIHGLVVDALGAPAAGISVQAWERMPRSLESDSPPPEAISASDGSFRIDGVPSVKKVTLLGVPQNGAPVGILQLKGPPPDGVRSGVRLELPAAGKILGTVSDEEGRPVRDARVSARSLALSGMVVAEVASDDAGRFELEGVPTGRIRVAAEAHNYLAARETVEVGETETAEAALVLETAYALSGFVLDEDGAGIPDLPVHVQEIVGAALSLDDEEEPVRATARSNAFGAFSFDGLPSRLYTVGAGSYTWERVSSDPEEIQVPTDERVLVLVQPRRRRERFTITGVVALADRKPTTELRFRGFVGGVLEVDGGEFRATGLTPTRHNVWVSRNGYAAERIGPIDPVPGGEVDVGLIELHPATLVTVKLVDEQKKPVKGAHVVLHPLPAERGGLGEEARSVTLSEGDRGRYRAWVRPFVWRVRAELEKREVAKAITVMAQEKQGVTLRLP